MKRLAVLAVLCVGLIGPVSADDLPDWIKKTKLSMLAFGDAYWVSQNHDPALEGENGFWFRRIYLTFDHEIDEDLDARLRFEANSPGDFTSGDKLEPFVKDAYVSWKHGNHNWVFGLSSSPTWAVVEKYWGLRHVEKTLLDLQKFGSSRDFGVALKGSLGEAKKIRYHAMLGNGSSTGGETNEGKKLMLSVGFYPSERIMVEIYGDSENRPGQTDRQTYQVFASFNGDWGRVGLQSARQNREVGVGLPDLEQDVASVFGVFKLTERAQLIGRFDRAFDPNPDGAEVSYIPFDPTAKSSFTLVGVEWKPREKLRVTPNVEFVQYDGVGGAADPADDLIVRLTLFVRS